LVSKTAFPKAFGTPNTYRGSIAMQHGIYDIRYVPIAFGMERTIALVLHDLETILYPYTVLFKGMVHARVVSTPDEDQKRILDMLKVKL